MKNNISKIIYAIYCITLIGFIIIWYFLERWRNSY